MNPFPLVLFHYRSRGGRGVSLPQHHAIKILPVGFLVQSKQKTSADKHFLQFSIDFFAPSTGATTETMLSIFFLVLMYIELMRCEYASTLLQVLLFTLLNFFGVMSSFLAALLNSHQGSASSCAAAALRGQGL